MFFVDDPPASARWWAEHLGAGAEVIPGPGGFCWCELGGIEIGSHPADDNRNSQGGSPVVYFPVVGLDARRAELLDGGCPAHRGPLEIEHGRSICQLVDPWGVVFGLDGPC
jgi:predicted enzyme related to lactoylglutathione lyase